MERSAKDPAKSDNWSPERPWAVAEEFLRTNDLDEPDIELLRLRHNAMFLLPENGLTLRIYGPEDSVNKARLMVAFARFLESRNFPAVRLSARFENQPMEVLGAQVSVWNWIDADPERPTDFRSFGALLRDLHAISNGFDYPTAKFDPMAKIRGRLDRIEADQRLRSDQLATLEDSYDRAMECAARLHRSRLGVGVLHGDATPGNVIQSEGRLHLIDFDSVCKGPREWDLAPTLVTAKRYGRRDAIWSDFLSGYGVAPGELSDLEPAAVIKQLSMTVVLCLRAGESDDVDVEIDRRVRAWADWDFDTPWHNPG